MKDTHDTKITTSSKHPKVTKLNLKKLQKDDYQQQTTTLDKQNKQDKKDDTQKTKPRVQSIAVKDLFSTICKFSDPANSQKYRITRVNSEKRSRASLTKKNEDLMKDLGSVG